MGFGCDASGSPDGRTARRGLVRRSMPGLGAADLAAWREATVAGEGTGAGCGVGPGMLFIKLSVVSRYSHKGTRHAALFSPMTTMMCGGIVGSEGSFGGSGASLSSGSFGSAGSSGTAGTSDSSGTV